MVWYSRSGKTCWILAVLLVITFMYTVSGASDTSSLIVIVTDARTAETVDGANIYIDGGYRGTTTSAGTLAIPGISAGKHTVRVTKTGFKEVTKGIIFPDELTVDIVISQGLLVALNTPGPVSERIDIVFYPSSTSYDCANHTRISEPVYLLNETRFKEDVMNLIDQTYLNLDEYTAGSTSLPVGYQNVFNFYYYYDPSAPADAFSGCSGTIPEKYFTEVPFNDVTVILYPTYYGRYADSTCQPTGCFEDFGPGRSLMKAPADKMMLFKHETGHAVFELVDTYCGETYYYQNDPYPNVWSTLESCKAYARANNRDPEQCRQIQKKSGLPTSCTRNYWQWDPQPDIMANGYGGKFGTAATQRINYVIAQAGTG